MYATIFVDSEEAEFMGYFTVGLHWPQRRSSGCEAGEGKLGFFYRGRRLKDSFQLIFLILN